ncbi:Protein of unknown function [Sphingomonas sp. OV641]|uniref:DUF3325 domain-containing protein n=1 Tax=unclassified Sphingomonas TaxID=196159 RepID=UPI000835F6A1|nr:MULTISPECIES: DUF3325 domain-containing protein [unclassified Sphingomonas]SEI75529.1 Protein of unknown function [Sphingomonas sp. OV641]
MTTLAFLLSLAAFGVFGFATDDHHHRLTGRRPTPSWKARSRAAAWVMLALAFVAAIAARGWVFGPVLWFGAIMVAAGLVFLALNFGPRRVRGTHSVGGSR